MEKIGKIMSHRETLIMKFGGASVSTPEQFGMIAGIIAAKSTSANVVVVVSAMGGATDQLLSLAKKVHPTPPLRELDMLVSVGERVSISLLAMALHLKEKEAISFTGSQSGIITTADHSNAKIIAVKPHRILRELELGKVVIVAGFQGVTKSGEITTLGRGGSDTTAVALGIALKATCVEFYKDVDGIYSEDPKSSPLAKKIDWLSYDQALAITIAGAKVLHPRCVQLAQKNYLPLRVLSFYDPEMRKGKGTLIHSAHSQESEGVGVYEVEEIGIS